jgi:hypothetical protein
MIEVQLRTERDQVIPAEPAGIDFELPRTTLLKYIDPYGKTVFNQLQMEDFLAEWEFAKSFAQTDEQKSNWKMIRELAIECRAQVHTFLTFLGE